jgi:CheY-like chemotaxis protein
METYNCILLVDDDPVDNFIAYTMLQELKLSNCICMCRNGKEALSFLDDYYHKYNSLPELIIVDALMPVMDGFEFLEEFRKKYGSSNDETKLFLLSTLYENEVIAIMNNSNLPYYLEKPFDKRAFSNILENSPALQVAM